MKQPKVNDLKLDKKQTKEIRGEMARSKKVKITINFDADILEEVREMAEDMGAPYQTLLNKIVRDSLVKKGEQESRLDKLEKELKQLKKKIA